MYASRLQKGQSYNTKITVFEILTEDVKLCVVSITFCAEVGGKELKIVVILFPRILRILFFSPMSLMYRVPLKIVSRYCLSEVVLAILCP